ncbi:uncharacterized protein LOC128672644 [Plodia interpunctella]|uniref:uncharacterized protein LOC128672644 n=1 Tax=Plodia interpunctella TaxID=58824 RepID=UPI0023674697|nr:uncharacterized protein LOC128672644 [Plodia interpunctella]XP_053605916.1 uncharacterized protein LOC128672644 [Plodia interpunctella]
MSEPEESERPRARPLSGGLWSLLWWLRRDGGSSDSLSSAGSDRTAASFAFLPPAAWRQSAPHPQPPPPPPSASYRKRLRDRDLRRVHDRDLTLHRKYGLHRDDVAAERDRRAASECQPRRSPHVPGKRRAPPPPLRSSATLPYRHSRKRRAPQPPIKFETKAKENIVEVQNTEMNPHPDLDKNSLPVDVSAECKSEKYVKKEHTITEAKSKQDKNFLKQIFDNKKRRSAIETSSVKILPNISELDKQAAELIESCRLKEQNSNVLNIDQKVDSQNSKTSKGPRWICISCLRRFDASITRCSFCLSPNKKSDIIFKNKNETIYTQTEKDLRASPTPKDIQYEERQQLKKMLKEMKDSLPKKHKPAEHVAAKNLEIVTSVPLLGKGTASITETPTLRIGASKHRGLNVYSEEPTSSKKALEISKNAASDNTNEIVRNILLYSNVKSEKPLTKKILHRDGQVEKEFHNENKTKSIGVKETTQLNVPLKISSLLNPVYVPKQQTANNLKKLPVISKQEDNENIDDKYVKSDNIELQNKTVVASTSNTSNTTKVENKHNMNVPQKKASPPVSKLGKRTVSTESKTSAANQKSIVTKVDEVNQHSRRRDLINQLEKSIAEGDERAAADAAAKLAQLRLSCSVLSFTSQILGQLSNHDNASQNMSAKNQNKQPVDHGSNHSSKVEIVPNTSKAPGAILETKEIKKNVTDTDQVVNHQPSCSKSPEEVNEKKVDAASSQEVARADGSNMASISIWIEDKHAAHGPVQLAISRDATLEELRARAAAELGVARPLQRWVVGRALCADARAPLRALAGPHLDAPFYLCLVEFDTKNKSISLGKNECTNSAKNIDNSGTETKSENDNAGDVYTELMRLESQAIVPNGDAFECPVCMEDCPAGLGAVLRECVHSFCRNCLADMIRHCAEPTVGCPAPGCPGTLHEREIRALVSAAECERWLARGLAAAESGERNAFHCRTSDCKGWALCEAGVRTFPCPVCKRNNCVPCQAIHEGETCEQYRSKLQQAANKVTNQTDEGTKALLDSLISRGEALECPECSAIITKKWGCDWVKCSACKTEICWVTRGRRWGPGGRGDTSAGCRCGVDGKRCHPSCGYCH